MSHEVQQVFANGRKKGGADSRIRTDDQRFTKPLLYH